MNKPIVDMRDATAAKDSERFGRAFSAITAACNSCHMAGRVGFIRIQTPTSSSFSDERYESGK
jgi:hypothetical protein